jgi:S1-C subfamily serine protease
MLSVVSLAITGVLSFALIGMSNGLDNISTKLDETNVKLSTNGNDISSLRADLATMDQTYVMRLNETTNNIGSRLDLLDGTIQNNSTRINAIDTSVATATQQIGRLQQQISDVNEKTEGFENLIDDKIAQNTEDTQDQIATLSGKVNLIQNTVNSFAGDSGSVASRITQMNASITAINTQISSLSTKVTRLDTSVTGLTNGSNNLSRQITQLNSDVSDLTDRVDDIDSRSYLGNEKVYQNAYDAASASVVKIVHPNGTASGIIASRNGYIITTYQAVQGGSNLPVYLNDGRQFTASLVNYNSQKDIALLRINETVNNLPVPVFKGLSGVHTGDIVIGVGYAATQMIDGQSVSAGVVSRVGRYIPTGNLNITYIQTDAAINPGTFGGALINQYGEVIGIMSRIITNSSIIGGQSTNDIYCSIPIQEALNLMP